MAETKLGRDVFIALAAIGWADGKLDADEADAIVRAAVEEGLELDEIEAIEAATKQPVAIGGIDIAGMSKVDRLFVYAVGSWITRIDGHVADEEREALAQLGQALEIPDRPRHHAETIVEAIGKLGESEEAAFFNLPMLRGLAEAQALRAQQSGDES
jgi:uncharacterized membrane protein YebE (DUF533 family)